MNYENKNMSISYKRTIIIALLLILLVFTGYFCWKNFWQKNVISFQNEEARQASEIDVEISKKTESEAEEPQQNNVEEISESAAQKTEEKPQVEKQVEKAAENFESEKIEKNEKVVSRLVSWGFQKSDSRKIDTIVVHSTYNTLSDDAYSLEGCISQFKQYGVSSHYIIDRSGKIYKLVDEKNIAYHAGISEMKDGRTNVNNFSVGIELIVKDSQDKPTDKQYDALSWLISDIKSRQNIKYIVGHSDIAPGRKTDPWGFDWGKIQK